MWRQRPGLIVYLDPTKDDHKKVLVKDSEFAAIRFRVVAKASHEFQEYREQLERETLSCYPESFWNPDYVEPKTIWDRTMDIIKEIFN